MSGEKSENLPVDEQQKMLQEFLELQKQDITVKQKELESRKDEIQSHERIALATIEAQKQGERQHGEIFKEVHKRRLNAVIAVAFLIAAVLIIALSARTGWAGKWRLKRRKKPVSAVRTRRRQSGGWGWMIRSILQAATEVIVIPMSVGFWSRYPSPISGGFTASDLYLFEEVNGSKYALRGLVPGLMRTNEAMPSNNVIPHRRVKRNRCS